MATSAAKSQIVHKHLRLDARKLKRLKKELSAKTETEAVSRAVDMVLSEYEKNRIIEKAHKKFFNSGIEIRDVYGALEPGSFSDARPL